MAYCKLKWILSLFQDFLVDQSKLALLFYDSQATMHIAANPVFHERIKHIDIDYHLVWDMVQHNFIKTLHVTSEHQLADLSKPLPFDKFIFLVSKLGLLDIHSPA